MLEISSRPARRFVAAVVFIFAFTFGCGVAFADVASAEGSTLVDPAEKTDISQLDNGLTLLMLEDHATPVVSFQMWVHVGSRDESRYTGLAHLFEHMMFKGSENIPPEEHAKLVQAHGGRLNAYTSNDFTVYFEDIPPEALPLVIDLEAERVAHLDISQETLTSEREVVIEERRMRTDDSPEGRAFEALLATTFQAHPYRWPVIGWRSDLEAATVEAAREFFDAYYVPNNITISIAGDFDPVPTRARIERAFGSLRSRDVARNPTREPEQRGERRAIVRFDVRAPLLAAAWHAPPTGHEDGSALDVLSQILSDGRSSRLYRSLVYEKESALFAHGAYWELVDAGVFYAFAGVRPGVGVDAVEKDFFAEIAKLRSEPVTAAELDKAKRQLEVSLVNGLRTNHALASRIGRDYSTFGRIRPLSERMAAIRAVTAEDVMRVAKTYLVDEHRTVVHVVPPPPGDES